jgi:putative restriction endonuclease
MPSIDDRLAPPDTRIEYLHGVKLFAAPAKPPHATMHARLAYVLEAYVAKGYIAAVDMLTRTGETSDFAPDASLFPSAPDPKTGGRRLEELAFEITARQAISVPTKKARELVRRGVRRVFCLLVDRKRVLEWSRETDGWQPLGDEAVLKDRCLVRPLPIRALLEATAGDEAVVKALRARRVPALVAALSDERREGEAAGLLKGKAEGLLEGKAEGLRAAIADLCEVLGVEVSALRRARLEAMTVSELEALRAALKQTRRWPLAPASRRGAASRRPRPKPPANKR